MKTIIACCLVLFLHNISWAQNNSSNTSKSTDFDLNVGLVITRNSTESGHVINIVCLPHNLEYSVVLKIELNPKEVYTFVKSNDLFIPEGYAVYIKDEGTGNVFDLDSTERHSFVTNRHITKYFLLECRKIDQVENLFVKAN